MLKTPAQTSFGRRTIAALIRLSLAGTALTATATAQDGPYQAQSGLIAIEMESAGATGSWSLESSPSGSTGAGHLRWTGPNLFNEPGSDIFGFDFEVTDPGRYHFRIHNRHDHADSTEANDVWVRMDGGPWIKVFSWQRGQWTWATQHEFSHDDKPPAEYQLGTGLHRIEFSGRSHDFMVDRFHLYRDGVSNPLSTSHPESPRSNVNDRPIASFTMDVDEIPAGDDGMTVVTLDGGLSTDPDGDTLTYDWDVRGVTFMKSTSRRSQVARVVMDGDFAMPIKLVVSDGELRDTTFRYINLAGSRTRVHGEGCVWHPVTIDFKGPASSETAASPNPFLDYRLNVAFTSPSGVRTVVPGFFDGDGQGGGQGDVWRVRFTPDEPGVWEYRSEMRAGEGVAVALEEGAGTPIRNGVAKGRFGVLPRDPQAEGLLADGRLEYVGEHHLKQRDGDWFVKTGTNSPENFMAYAGFDNVQDMGGVGIIHHYQPHVQDWRPGDPQFSSETTGVDSKGIIGALNYLGEQGVNALYFLPMNMGGDGQDTTPFVGYDKNEFNNTHYDISRLSQWNQVLDHAQRQGILLHLVLAETEAPNETWLDGGSMGVERKLYFRELIARFGYVNGLKWNLSEENDYPVAVLREMASYIKAVDPYDHMLAVHTHPNDISDYHQLVGDPNFDAASIQYSPGVADNLTQAVRNLSNSSGRKWIIDMDENGTWNEGLSASNAEEMRCEVLYDVLLSHGGIEWYAGYHPLPLGGDVKLENFRTREEMWRYSRIARELIEEHVDLINSHPADGVVTGGTADFGGAEVLMKANSHMMAFLPNCSQAPVIDMSNLSGTYRVRWFDPRTGDEVGEGPQVTGTGSVTLEVVPTERDVDWVVLLERI